MLKSFSFILPPRRKGAKRERPANLGGRDSVQAAGQIHSAPSVSPCSFFSFLTPAVTGDYACYMAAQRPISRHNRRSTALLSDELASLMAIQWTGNRSPQALIRRACEPDQRLVSPDSRAPARYGANLCCAKRLPHLGSSWHGQNPLFSRSCFFADFN